jgi:hypothetical protein
MEDDFPKKALALYRRQWPKSLTDGISTARTSPNVSVMSRPSTAPEYDDVESKYMSTARFSQARGPDGGILRPLKLLSKLDSLRPATAPDSPLIGRSIDSVPAAAKQVFVMQIVESPASFSVRTEKGTVKIPSRHWIALEPKLEEEEPDDLGLPVSFAGRKLLKALGGGIILEKGSELVRLVPDGRLHLAAAEANLKRASRGNSVLTLLHASYARQLLSEREKEVETGAMSLPLQLCTFSTAHLNIGVSKRFNRFRNVVTSADKATKRRDAEKQLAKLLGSETAFHPDATALTTRPGRLLMGNKLLQQGVVCLEQFYTFMRLRHLNAVKVWFMLDPEENMKLGERMFVSRVTELGFRGNIAAMYKYIDSDRSGSITILELDSYAATRLAEFRKFLFDYFDGSADAFLERVARNGRCGPLLKTDMVSCCRRFQTDVMAPKLSNKFFGGSDTDAEEMFDLLDRRGLGHIVTNDLKWLLKWKPRPYLCIKADFQALKQIKEGLLLINGPPLWRSWRTVLDTDCTMRISWEEFYQACRKLSRQVALKAPGHTVPKTEDEIGAAWRAVDTDCSGWIALKEFDPPCYQAIKAFKQWAMQEFGSVMVAMKKLDGNGNGRLGRWELKKSETCPNAYPGDVEELFDILDLPGQHSLGEAEVKFLDDWDLAWDEYEESAGCRRRTVHAATRNLTK